ncbi:MAG: ATP-dependent helicase, partial [Candidatus Saccharimonadales bacterium]
MSNFEKRYKNLNPAQKKAVDTIEGPLMVVAGPGTGKTELLSMRVANILKKTDALPQNILCLTYTESGATAMRERLIGLIGADAYKVAIHTFHSFGSEIINRYGEYFYNGAHFRPADELSGYEILLIIFEKLPHDEKLASTMNGEFTYLRDTQSAISDLKKSGLTSDELENILERNERFIDWVQPRLHAVLSERMSKKTIPSIGGLLDDMATYKEEDYELITYEPLSELVYATLEMAVEQAEADGNTKPLTAWKKDWCERREDGEITLKDAKRSKRLRSVARIYYEYLIAMQERELFDFDDMILRAVHATEIYNDLRLNLQEQYQYLLVDEFQDTNDAQMRLLWNLTNNPTSESRPNVMIVGDDDQAIYRFQGAKLSNILDFRKLYHDVQVVTLTENYRSAGVILDTARQTITRAAQRLEHSVPEVNKTLVPNFKPSKPEVTFTSYPDETSEYTALAASIVGQQKDNPDATIAVIARNHRQLKALVPYLQEHGINLSYDRRDNVLETPPVLFLELLSRVISYIGQQHLQQANALLPELLAHPAWSLPSATLWQLSVESHATHKSWFEVMLQKEGTLQDIAQWLIASAYLSLNEPLEYVLDHLAGTDETQAPNESEAEAEENEPIENHEGFSSPLRNYFFSHKRLQDDPSSFIVYLDALTSIRRKIRDYRPEGQLSLNDFIHCLDKYRELGIGIQGSGHVLSMNNPIELLSAHRSKGLEFDTVYIVGLSDSIWGETARTRGKLISYPHNLALGISGDSSDEHIRLLFVALTRARANLQLSTHQASTSGKSLLPVGYLDHVTVEEKTQVAPMLELVERAWHGELTRNINHSMEELLRDRLNSYKLSATHLGNFLDITRGGPELFLLQNLLRFPQAMSPSAAFGSAVHRTLQRAHAHFSATGKKHPVEDL